MKVFIVDKDSKEEVCEQLQEANEEIQAMIRTFGSSKLSGTPISYDRVVGEEDAPSTGEHSPQPTSFGIVINGHSLVCVL